MAAILILGGLMSGLAGCRATRGPNSPNPPPPIDPQRALWEEKFAQLMTAEMQLPSWREYTIGPGDTIAITMVGRPDIFGFPQAVNPDQEGGTSGPQNILGTLTLQISESPVIVLPYVGEIRVHGKTAAQLQEELKTLYGKFIRDPQPIVLIEEFYQNQVAVLGSVVSPGRFPLDIGDTLIDLIFKASGPQLGRGNPPARILKVYREKLSIRERLEMTPDEIIERLREGDALRPREEIIVPLDEFLIGGDISFNIPLMPNDIVYLPPAGTINVHGIVQNARVVFLGPSLRTVVQVLTEVGGLRYAAATRIELVRSYPDGTQKSFYMDARRMMRRADPDFMVQENDQIFVYRHTGRSIVAFIETIFRVGFSTGVNASYSPGV